MALTLLDIHRINTGIIRPVDITLTELIVLQARRHASYIRNNFKDIEDDALAESYKNKLQNTVNQILQGNNSKAKDMLPIFTNAIGNIQNVEDLKTQTTEGWTTLIENEIAELFEVASGITPEEKTAYDEYTE